MLKELFQKQQETPRVQDLPPQEAVRETVKTFDTLIDFLREPERFPNQEINKLTILSWRLIGNKHVQTALYEVPSISFAVVRQEARIMPIVLLPYHYIDKVRENPGLELGGMTNMASQIRDYYTGALMSEGSENSMTRSMAFEAEALNTVEKMAQKEGVELNWTVYQEKVLARFPGGLSDLPEELRYPTPDYPETF